MESAGLVNKDAGTLGVDRTRRIGMHQLTDLLVSGEAWTVSYIVRSSGNSSSISAAAGTASRWVSRGVPIDHGEVMEGGQCEALAWRGPYPLGGVGRQALYHDLHPQRFGRSAQRLMRWHIETQKNSSCVSVRY